MATAFQVLCLLWSWSLMVFSILHSERSQMKIWSCHVPDQVNSMAPLWSWDGVQNPFSGPARSGPVSSHFSLLYFPNPILQELLSVSGYHIQVTTFSLASGPSSHVLSSLLRIPFSDICLPFSAKLSSWLRHCSFWEVLLPTPSRAVSGVSPHASFILWIIILYYNLSFVCFSQ